MKITEQDKSDIRVSYRQAANQRKQIGILAELYATDKNVIRGILGMGPERPRSKMASPRKSVHHPVQMRIAVAMQAKARRAAGGILLQNCRGGGRGPRNGGRMGQEIRGIIRALMDGGVAAPLPGRTRNALTDAVWGIPHGLPPKQMPY